MKFAAAGLLWLTPPTLYPGDELGLLLRDGSWICDRSAEIFAESLRMSVGHICENSQNWIRPLTYKAPCIRLWVRPCGRVRFMAELVRQRKYPCHQVVRASFAVLPCASTPSLPAKMI